jgi:hypothetical protein
MSGEQGQTRPANAPFWKAALVLWGLSLLGALLVLPYAVTLETKALAAAAARTHMPLSTLLLLSTLQTAVLLGVAVSAGLWAARKLCLSTPLIAAFLLKTRAPRYAALTLLFALALGLLAGVALLALDRYLFAPLPSVAALIKSATGPASHPRPWQGLLASFYGALDEEILMRLGLLSLIALLLRTIARWLGASRDVPLPSGVFWTANIATAVVFGLGHLPATAALAPLTPALVVRAVVLNGTAGLVYGWLFRRFGLEWAMVSHFGTDIVLHVVAGG